MNSENAANSNAPQKRCSDKLGFVVDPKDKNFTYAVRSPEWQPDTDEGDIFYPDQLLLKDKDGKFDRFQPPLKEKAPKDWAFGSFLTDPPTTDSLRSRHDHDLRADAERRDSGRATADSARQSHSGRGCCRRAIWVSIPRLQE